jgi:hypothetical protein
MFKARRDTKALEVYWSELSLNDIERDIVGGMSQDHDLFPESIGDIFGVNVEGKDV